MIISAITL